MRPLAPGALVGTFRVVRLLGQGAMGAVYEAKDEQGGLVVALKVVAAELAADPKFIRRFGREARTGAGIEHPNVVRVHDAGSAGGIGFIALELLPGGSLADRLERAGPYPWREAAALGAQIARGLTAIHGAGFVHRDLKPQNVMLDAAGTPKVADLGLAGHAGGGRSLAGALTKTGELLGTPSYMAPEQAGGEPVTAKADLYALGCVVHALVAGRPPFEGESYALIAKHLREAPPPLRKLAPGTPHALEALVLRLLEKEPARRPGSALEVALELEEIAAGRAARQRRLLAVPLVIAALAVAAAAALVVADGRGTGPAPPGTDSPDRTPPGPSPQQPPPGPSASGATDGPLELIGAPLGERLRRIHSHVPEPLPTAVLSVALESSGATALALAPDGAAWVGLDDGRVLSWKKGARVADERLAKVRRPETVRALAAAGEDRLLVASASLECVKIADGSVAWSRGDLERTTRLAVARDRVYALAKGALHRIPVEGGAGGDVLRLPATGEAITSFALSRDASQLSVGTASGQVWSTPLASVAFKRRDRGERGAVRDMAYVDESLVVTVHAAVNERAPVFLWEDMEDQPEPVQPTHSVKQDLLACAVSPDRTRLAFAGESRQLFVYERTSNRSLSSRLIATTPRAVTALAFASDDRLLGTARDGALREWDAKKSDPEPWKGHEHEVTAVAWLPDGRVASAGLDELVRVWDTARGRLATTLAPEPHRPLIALAATPDGKKLLVGSDLPYDPRDGASFQAAASLFDLESGGPPEQIRHEQRVTGVGFAGDKLLTASRSGEFLIQERDGTKGLPNLAKRYRALSVSKDGKEALIAGGSAIYRASIDDPIARQRSDYAHATDYLMGVAHADARYAASVDDQGHLYVWDLDKYPLGGTNPPKPLAVRDHGLPLHAVAFVAGDRVVVACDDGKLWLHEPARRNPPPPVSVALPDADVPLSLAVSPDRRELVVGTARGVVLRYRVK